MIPLRSPFFIMPNTYFPIIVNNTSSFQTFGFDVGWFGTYKQNYDTIKNIHTFVHYPIIWDYFQPTNSNEFIVDPRVEEDLNLMVSNQCVPILNLKMTPAWARPIGSNLTDPPENPNTFADFAVKLARRFPAVKHFEIGNEIDSDGGIHPHLGAWGKPDEPYYGGSRYAKIINPIYDAIKAENLINKVWFGGLMAASEPMRQYLEGAIIAGARFDVVSYHVYQRYPTAHVTDVKERTEFLKNILRIYKRDAQLFLSETSLLCEQDYPPAFDKGNSFFAYQAAYAYNVKKYIEDEKLLGCTWYALKAGWMNSDLLYSDNTSRPALKILNIIPR